MFIDTGIPGGTNAIEETARVRFSKNFRPAAIILTHGHFDYVGSLVELARRWNAPVYAHELEMPYLNGRASYPEPDPMWAG